MKKCLLVLVALLVVSLALPAFADQTGYPSRGKIKLQSTGLISFVGNHTHVVTSPCYVYRITMRAQEALNWVALADSANTGAEATIQAFTGKLFDDVNARVKVDIAEATAGDWLDVDFRDNPLYFEQGIFISMGTTDSSGNAFQCGSAAETPNCIIHYTGADN